MINVHQHVFALSAHTAKRDYLCKYDFFFYDLKQMFVAAEPQFFFIVARLKLIWEKKEVLCSWLRHLRLR